MQNQVAHTQNQEHPCSLLMTLTPPLRNALCLVNVPGAGLLRKGVTTRGKCVSTRGNSCLVFRPHSGPRPAQHRWLGLARGLIAGGSGPRSPQPLPTGGQSGLLLRWERMACHWGAGGCPSVLGRLPHLRQLLLCADMILCATRSSSCVRT